MRSGAVFSLILLTFTLVACGPNADDEEIPVIDLEQEETQDQDTSDGSNNGGATDPTNNGGSANNGSINNGSANNGTNGGANNGGGGQSNNGGETVVTADEVDPSCIDGQYAETLPDPAADISAEINAYSLEQLRQFYDDILEKRYPVGAHLVRGGSAVFDCVEVFARNPSTAETAIARLSVVVHECAHAFDLSQGVSTYVITPELTLSCSGAGNTFARSEIGNDEYQQKRPPCQGGVLGCDHYYDMYLEGRGSDQGFDMVLEETVQYINSLATSFAFQEYISGSTSALDGILTFLWYLERYLRMARLEYPEDYAKLTEPCWREAILTTWGRAWWIIEQAKGVDALGIDEEALFELVRDPELLGEIQRLRDLEGC